MSFRPRSWLSTASGRLLALPRGRLVVLAALVAYALWGAVATVQREAAVRNICDEIMTDGPRARLDFFYPWGFPWLPRLVQYPEDFEEDSGLSGVDRWGGDPGYESYATYDPGIGKPWDGMEYVGGGGFPPRLESPTGYAGIDVSDQYGLSFACYTPPGTTGEGLSFAATFTWEYDGGSRCLVEEVDYQLQRAGASISQCVSREEWLAATGVDGERLDAWAHRVLWDVLLGGVVDASGGASRFSRNDYGDLRVVRDEGTGRRESPS